MTEKLVEHAPRVRCYECGNAAIVAMCHHCRRPMCEQHSPPAFRQGSTLVRTPAGAEEARPASKEFAGLGLGGLREAVYHCKEHDHLVRGLPLRWILIGAGIGALGFLLLFASAVVGVLFLLAGAATAGIPLLMHRMSAANLTRPPLPLVPQVHNVGAVERLAGYVRIENEAYKWVVAALDGRLTVAMSANDGPGRLRAYREKFGLDGSEQVPFAGGFLMLEGEAGLRFKGGQEPVLSLGGDSVHGHGFFPNGAETGQRGYTITLDYDLQDGRGPDGIPLWIVPSLVPASGRRTLDIDLHWTHPGPDEQPLSLSMFDLVELRVPAGWGNVEGSAPVAPETGKDGGRRTIRWKQLRPRQTGDSSLRLTLTFPKAIGEEIDPIPDDYEWRDGHDPLTISGMLKATFTGLLSGVTGARVFLPGGGENHRPPATLNTTVEITFDVSLRSVRYQDERVVPDAKNPRDVTRADEFHGAVPDHVTVAELTSAISMDEYYVKSVVEHPPYRDDARPGVLNRVWDVAGRRYIGLFPIDFDISLRGEEVETPAGISGKTVAQVTVKGTYATGALVGPGPSADELDAGAHVEVDPDSGELLMRIEDTWDSLHARVTDVLAGRVRRAVAALPAATEGVQHSELLDPGSPDLPDDVVIVEAVPTPDYGAVLDGETVLPAPRTAADETVIAARIPDQQARQVEELRRQQAAADDALLAGRIGEDTHRGIVARIEAALTKLGETR
ncbi:hypothetical protein [Phytohabitans houttuyneae]|uniref:Uncharacterized protein n=1 Tax=Phytohabitans houttuyneae TaxID=1076126 RepID=A0A6V8KJ85_9ACTN|nr:hypothetical protein [Phytohabitans houttuyneae]GFJ83490.1 hypothetical protein Phou_076700 [Phytohabitans houttuyneae]